MQTEPITINIGPQHPSTHGVFRLRVKFDGEVIQDLEPVFGYLHRGTEKLAEERTYTQVVTLTDRMDYTASMTNNQAYVLTVEKLAGIQPTERGMYLRVIAAELQRVASHMMAIGFLIQDLGAMGTPLMYCFRERERILDLFEMLCGARITVSYMRPGGVFQDAPQDFWPALRMLLDELPHYIDELERLLTENEVLLVRTKGVGVLGAQQAVNASISGPNLRASGIPWDLRKADPYEVYDRVDFQLAVGSRGDSYDRLVVRLLEMRESLRIVEQCVRDIPTGPVRAQVPLLPPPPRRRGLRPRRSPQGRVGLLHGQRWRRLPLPLQGPLPLLHQPHGAQGPSHRLEDRRPHGHLRQH